MCCCHDKRLRVSRLLCDRFPQYLSLFCFFVLFSQNGRLFLFLRNIHSSIEILKIKILEYSYAPSQYFFGTKAFIPFLSCRRKVALCQSGRMAHTPRTVPINVPIDRITPGYRQAVFQFSVINLTNRIGKRNLSTPPQLTTCHKWHRTTSHCLSTFSQNLHHEECPR